MSETETWEAAWTRYVVALDVLDVAPRGRASRGARLRAHKAWRACYRLDARLMCEIGTGL